jgi:exo-beta-1,3-glucanase (GH17 family)
LLLLRFRHSYAHQVTNIVKAAHASAGVPVVVGETGIPFDLNGGAAFKTRDWRWQERALDAICHAMEAAGVSFV